MIHPIWSPFLWADADGRWILLLSGWCRLTVFSKLNSKIVFCSFCEQSSTRPVAGLIWLSSIHWNFLTGYIIIFVWSLASVANVLWHCLHLRIRVILCLLASHNVWHNSDISAWMSESSFVFWYSLVVLKLCSCWHLSQVL